MSRTRTASAEYVVVVQCWTTGVGRRPAGLLACTWTLFIHPFSVLLRLSFCNSSDRISLCLCLSDSTCLSLSLWFVCLSLSHTLSPALNYLSPSAFLGSEIIYFLPHGLNISRPSLEATLCWPGLPPLLKTLFSALQHICFGFTPPTALDLSPR